MYTCPVCTMPLSITRAFFSAGLRGFFRCPVCRGHLQIHGRLLPIVTAIVVAIGFIALDFSGKITVNALTWWWDLFQAASVLFILFVTLNWTLRIDRRQPLRKFVF